MTCPKPKYLDGDIARTAGCRRVPPVGGGSRRTREALAPRSLGPHICQTARRHPPSPEPGARASVCKQTGHVAAATRSPPLTPREPSGSPLGTATAPPQPSLAARSLRAPPSPGRTARTGAKCAPRPREPNSRSLIPGGRLPGPASAGLGCSGVLGDEGLHG